ncbi:hypothetical protein Q2941_16960 [Bradyrhizobium sp. UFLA05-153]
MKRSRRQFLSNAAAVAGTVAMPSFLRAQSGVTEIRVAYSIPVLFKDLMESLAKEFQAKNPSVKVTLRAPENGYEEIMQRPCVTP